MPKKKKFKPRRYELKFPYFLERESEFQSKKLRGKFEAIINKFLSEDYQKIKNEYKVQNLTDSIKLDADWRDSASKAMDKVKFRFEDAVNDTMGNDWFEYVGERHNKWHVLEWRAFLASTYGVEWFKKEPWVKPFIQNEVTQNTQLVKNLSQEVFQQVDRTVKRGIENQVSVKTLKKMLLSDTDLEPLELGIPGFTDNVSAARKLENRAELIAVDQVGKFNSQISQKRQTETGFKGYKWLTAKDRRVRGNPTGLYPNAKYKHWDREGKFYMWNQTENVPEGYEATIPADGHPGYSFRCRCVAQPDPRWVFVDEFETLESKESI